MKKIQKGLLVVVLFFFFLFSANLVFALEITYPPIPGVMTPQEFIEKIKKGEIPSEKALSLYGKYIFYLSLMSGGFIAVGAVILGGIRYLISGGSATKMKDAKEQISSGILGLIIIFSSYILVTTINPQLAIFVIGKPEIEEPELPGIPEIGEEVPVYVEIPLGWLNERVKAKSKVARDQAEDVEYVGAETGIKTHTSLRELAECLKILTVGREDDPSTPEDETFTGCDCTLQDTDDDCCPSEPTDGSCPANDTGNCCDDPCDRDVSTHICAEEVDESLDNLCPSEVCNLRDVIDAKKAELETKTDQLWEERADAERARKALIIELDKLKLAEALMRDSLYPPLNYHNFIALEDVKSEKLEGWEHVEGVPISSFPRDPSVPPPPPRECSSDQRWEIVPACTICKDILFCYGNKYRLCDTDSPPIPAPTGNGTWYLDISGAIQYNSVTYSIPSGGAFVCDANTYGCNNERCKEGGEGLKIGVPTRYDDDPANFYVPKKGNEDLIAIVGQSLAIIQGSGFGPAPGPGIPGTYCEDLGRYISTWDSAKTNLDSSHLDAIRAASVATGVRQSLILAIISWESGFNSLAGFPNSYCCGRCDGEKGYLGCWDGDCHRCSSHCLSDPYGNCQSFDGLWDSFGASYWDTQHGFSSKDEVRFSRCGTYLGVPHCGGAMGLAQAMPFSWEGIMGLNKDPWNLADAYLFVALHLQKRGGADSKTCSDEIDAVWRYVGKNPADRATAAHAACIVQLANYIAENNEFGIEEDPCAFPQGFLQVACTVTNPSENIDLNPKLKGYREVNEPKELFTQGGPIDSKAPKLQTMLGRRPNIKTVYALDSPTSHEVQWPVHLAGFLTVPGESIRVPRSGYELSGGYEVVVIFASEDALTIKYTEDDFVQPGYTIQFQNIEVDAGLLSKYREHEQCIGSQRVLPAYVEGDVLGHAVSDELIITIRDTGAWMDPRWEDHWWQP